MGTKSQGSAAARHDAREVTKGPGVKTERAHLHGNNECFVFGKQGHKQWGCRHMASRARRGNIFTPEPWADLRAAPVAGRPVQHYSSNATGESPGADAPAVAVGREHRRYKTVSKYVATQTEPAAPAAGLRHGGNYVYIPVPRQRVAPIDAGVTTTAQHAMSHNAGPHGLAQARHSVPVRFRAPASQPWGVEQHFAHACFDRAAWWSW